MQHVCKTCGYKAATHILLGKHKKTHYKWRCKQCAFASKTAKAYTTHMREAHGVAKPLKCTECDDRFANVQTRSRHMIIKHEPHSFICDQCDFTASRKAYVDRHVRNTHTEKKHECPECGHLSRSAHNLKMHMLVHGPPTFACSLCPVKCRQPTGLRNHMFVHCTCANGGGCSVHKHAD